MAADHRTSLFATNSQNVLRTYRSIAGAVILATVSFVVCEQTAIAAVQTDAQQTCSTDLNKPLQKLVSAAGKNACSCLKDIAKGNTSAEGCFGNDPKEKFAGAAARATQAFQVACVGIDPDTDTDRRPDFAAGAVGPMIATARDGSIEIIQTLFGDDLGAALPVGNPDKGTNKCQQGVAKAAKK